MFGTTFDIRFPGAVIHMAETVCVAAATACSAAFLVGVALSTLGLG